MFVIEEIFPNRLLFDGGRGIGLFAHTGTMNLLGFTTCCKGVTGAYLTGRSRTLGSRVIPLLGDGCSVEIGAAVAGIVPIVFFLTPGHLPAAQYISAAG